VILKTHLLEKEVRVLDLKKYLFKICTVFYIQEEEHVQ